MFTEVKTMDTPLDQGNLGHQLLKKMGWGGQGLGKSEHGIVNPIKGGEVRDKQDQFKGIGVKTDDFENFRKNRSAGYHTRQGVKQLNRREEAAQLDAKYGSS